MDIQEIAETAARLDPPAEDVFMISIRAPRVDLTDGEGNLTTEAEELAADILDTDHDELLELQESVDDLAATGPLLNPGEVSVEKAGKAKDRTDAFVEAHEALREAEWDKERYEALRDFKDAV